MVASRCPVGFNPNENTAPQDHQSVVGVKQAEGSLLLQLKSSPYPSCLVKPRSLKTPLLSGFKLGPVVFNAFRAKQDYKFKETKGSKVQETKGSNVLTAFKYAFDRLPAALPERK